MIFDKYKFVELIVLILILITLGQAEWTIVNLDEKCMFCLCEAATGCDKYRQCNGNDCGPFKLSKEYWQDADNITMIADDYRRAGAYQACANDYYCARKIVKKYLAKFGWDCNADGVTDCFDYLMINFNGRLNSRDSLKKNADGISWLGRFSKCMA